MKEKKRKKIKESFGGMGGGVGKKERKKERVGRKWEEENENGEKWGKRQHLTWNIQLLKNLYIQSNPSKMLLN